jgi:hypothetical protein
MTFPIVVQPCEGQFAASLLGDPKVRVIGRNRSLALDAPKTENEHRVAIGELLTLELDAIGVTELAGKYQTGPTLRTIGSEAYGMQDADRS